MTGTRGDVLGRELRCLSLLDAALIGGLALPLLSMIWVSRDWTLIHDAPLLHYIAWMISEALSHTAMCST